MKKGSKFAIRIVCIVLAAGIIAAAVIVPLIV